MVIVMMKTTMLLANLMVEIVVLTLWKIGICTAVNVPVYLVMPQLVSLEYHNGLVIASVMMKTTTLFVDLMVEIAATIILLTGTSFVMIVNACLTLMMAMAVAKEKEKAKAREKEKEKDFSNDYYSFLCYVI